MSAPALSRVAGAPISWGVCEVPGWGHQMRPERVLMEMQQLGLVATELGPAGFLPGQPLDRARVLEQHGLRAVGGFVPLVMHDGFDVTQVLSGVMSEFKATGTTLVLAAATGHDGYDGRPALSAEEWAALLSALDAVHELAQGLGVNAVLHPHVGTVVETAADVERVLADSDIDLCLDTGHLLIGGTDPLELVKRVASRVGHVHLKDVHSELAEQVRDGGLGYSSAVREGLYPVLGRGDVDITGVVSVLESAGYTGWYVLEQDVVLDAEPPPGLGPVSAVRTAIEHLLGADVVSG